MHLRYKLIDCDVKHTLDEPNREALSLLGLELSESLVTVYENKVLLPIENPQGIPVRLYECFELGTVKLVDLSATKGERSTVESCQTSSKAPTVERAKKLLNVLSLPGDKLAPAETDADVFALDDTELGCTDLVDTLDTGDRSPVHQPPYRTPVIRRAELDRMVVAMQEQEPSCSPWAGQTLSYWCPKKTVSSGFV